MPFTIEISNLGLSAANYGFIETTLPPGFGTTSDDLLQPYMILAGETIQVTWNVQVDTAENYTLTFDSFYQGFIGTIYGSGVVNIDVTVELPPNTPPSIPTIIDPGVVSTTSSVEVNWSASTDDYGLDYYELQVDDEIGFATPINSYNVTGLSHIVSGLTNGTYYFRVRAVDIDGLASGWSSVVDINVEIPATNIPWWAYLIGGGGLLLIVLIVIVVLIVRKKKTPTR